MYVRLASPLRPSGHHPGLLGASASGGAAREPALRRPDLCWSLWTSPQSLPAVVGRISPYLPTLCYAEVAWTAVLGRPWWLEDWLWLLGYAVAFGSLAVWGYRRDEGQCYY